MTKPTILKPHLQLFASQWSAFPDAVDHSNIPPTEDKLDILGEDTSAENQVSSSCWALISDVSRCGSSNSQF